MPDSSPREQVRKDLRALDNPKSGKNPNYQNPDYALSLVKKHGKTIEELRLYATERQHRNFNGKR